VAFLRQLVRRIAGGPHVTVGAFGKCPLWADHIYPDIGLDGGLLSDLKQTLYLDGIRDRAIGSWGKADPSQLIPFGHELLWLADRHVVAGRLWYSKDGRDRDDFPMVIAADCSGGVDAAWVLEHVMPVLEDLEGRIKLATHRDTVSMLATETAEVLQQRAAETGARASAGNGPVPSEALLQLSRCDELAGAANGEGLARVMHVLRDVPARGMASAPSEAVRVPWCGAGSARQAMLLWSRALEARFGQQPAALLIAPFDGKWIDVLVGRPDPAQFIALRASPQLLPMTTDIGYAIDAELQGQVREMIETAERRGR
jgi:hypothetical protein